MRKVNYRTQPRADTGRNGALDCQSSWVNKSSKKSDSWDARTWYCNVYDCRAAYEHGLREKQWSCQMYDKKEIWASPYLRDKFCAGYRTISWCEGINVYVNKFSKSTHTIFELEQSLEMVAHEYRNKKMLLQFQSINSVRL
ncbi:hypothetical protein Ahy_A03g014266 [Arachis hypogaea]|uniref:Protein FAR1-RELATED SEQUENCE n=1 Tax=Arachis hypogaea TaxID=3818 RepID=A0A445DXB1_ARAHY|nr:hypothetical protein Ahy_A03g014266 [Arachis hypogaea]